MVREEIKKTTELKQAKDPALGEATESGDLEEIDTPKSPVVSSSALDSLSSHQDLIEERDTEKN